MIMFRKKNESKESFKQIGYSIHFNREYEVGTLKERVSMLKELGCTKIEIATNGKIFGVISKETIEKTYGDFTGLVIALDERGVNIKNEILVCPELGYVKEVKDNERTKPEDCRS